MTKLKKYDNMFFNIVIFQKIRTIVKKKKKYLSKIMTQKSIGLSKRAVYKLWNAKKGGRGLLGFGVMPEGIEALQRGGRGSNFLPIDDT